MTRADLALLVVASMGAISLLVIGVVSIDHGNLVRKCNAACRPSVGRILEDNCVCAQAGGVWAPPAAPVEKP